MANKPHVVKCAVCGIEFEIADSSYRYRLSINPTEPKFYCKNHRGIARSEGIKMANAALSEEEKEKKRKEQSERAKKQWESYDAAKRQKIHETFSKGQRKRIENMTPEELEKYKQSQSEKAKNEALNRTQEQKEDFSKKCSKHSKEMWANRSEEERDEIRRKQSDGLKRYINSLSPEELEKRNQRLVDGYANLSSEKKDEISRKLSVKAKDRYESMSGEDQKKKMESIHDGFNDYFSNPENVEKFSKKMIEMHANRTPEQKAEYVRKMKEWRDNLSMEERAIHEHNRLLAITNSQDNYLTKKFETSFNGSIISRRFYLRREVILYTEKILHSWDYGVYDKDNELAAVVDVDGEYHHGLDAFEYDGVRSRLESDEARELSVGLDIPIFIITESNFDKDFKRMEEWLGVEYNKYCDRLFKEYRAMPFPYPHYTDIELMKSWDGLVKMKTDDKYHMLKTPNSREGDHICYHFHPSIWHVNTSVKSSYDAWNDDTIMKDLIHNHILYQSYLNPNKILQGFAVIDDYRREYFTSPGMSKLMITRYLNEFDTIFDPFSRYSGRMLGAISCNKKYIGVENNETILSEAYNILEFLTKFNIAYDVELSSMHTNNTYDCLFTDVENDSMIDMLIKTFKCKKYLLIIPYTHKYASNIVTEFYQHSVILI